jgi:hypothetical protein
VGGQLGDQPARLAAQALGYPVHAVDRITVGFTNECGVWLVKPTLVTPTI